MTKPTVFNYGHYESLRDKCNDMAVTIAELTDKVKHQAEEVNRLKEENTNLKIKCRILEADNKKLSTEAIPVYKYEEVKKAVEAIERTDKCSTLKR